MKTQSDCSNPTSYEDVVDLLVPELQKRGLMWDDYHVPGGTFRENLQNRPGRPHLGSDHPGYQFKWNKSTAAKASAKVNGVKRNGVVSNGVSTNGVSKKRRLRSS